MDYMNKVEKMVKVALAVMLLISAALMAAWFLSDNKNSRNENSIQAGEKSADSNSAELAGKMNLLPDKCTLNQDLSDLSFVGEKGDMVPVSEFKGKTVVLNFWASWCPYCNSELEQTAQTEAMLTKYPEVKYLLVNKLDNNRETKEKALDYLKRNKIRTENVFDENLAVYNRLGLKAIPTMLVLDGQGRLKAWHAGKDMEPGVLKSMLDYTVNGGAADVLNFIEKELTNDTGGVNTTYLPEKGSNLRNTDVLSESQGLLMEYAVLAADKDLFDKTYKYVKEEMRKNPLAAWVVTSKGPAPVNSAVDDLRLFRALYMANEKWGGYQEVLNNYEKALYRYNTQNQKLINQYDYKYRKKAGKLKLCFADLEALQKLAALKKRWEAVYQNSLSVIKQGYIGNQFPMYYTEYDYSKKTYKHEDINMAEEMVALLNLSKTGQIKPQTLQWIKSKVSGDGIFARYNTGGRVVEGYRYESTAIYGLVSMIAGYTGDKDLANRALAKMEAMRIFNSDKKVNGAFGNPDGTGIYSFDQCIGLLAYANSGENNSKEQK